MARHELGPVANFSPGCQKLISLDGVAIALFRVGERFFATADLCPHRGGPLSEGVIDGGAVVCPWHQSRFDLETGSVLQGPATRAVKVFATEIVDGKLFLNL